MLIFMDVETTGLERDDVLCTAAVIDNTQSIYELFNEGKKISSLASSIHHVTNEMIQDKGSFYESNIYEFLQENNMPANTLILHNVKFCLEKLSTAGLDWKGDVIDTSRVSKHLIQECELFSLEFLRYELKLYKKEEVLKQQYGIKDALCESKALHDALLTKLLFAYLCDYATVDEMKELSYKNVLLEKFTFGKYAGKYIEDIVLNDRAYIAWMLNLEKLDEDLKYSLEYYMRG